MANLSLREFNLSHFPTYNFKFATHSPEDRIPEQKERHVKDTKPTFTLTRLETQNCFFEDHAVISSRTYVQCTHGSPNYHPACYYNTLQVYDKDSSSYSTTGNTCQQNPFPSWQHEWLANSRTASNNFRCNLEN